MQGCKVQIVEMVKSSLTSPHYHVADWRSCHSQMTEGHGSTWTIDRVTEYVKIYLRLTYFKWIWIFSFVLHLLHKNISFLSVMGGHPRHWCTNHTALYVTISGKRKDLWLDWVKRAIISTELNWNATNWKIGNACKAGVLARFVCAKIQNIASPVRRTYCKSKPLRI